VNIVVDVGLPTPGPGGTLLEPFDRYGKGGDVMEATGSGGLMRVGRRFCRGWSSGEIGLNAVDWLCGSASVLAAVVIPAVEGGRGWAVTADCVRCLGKRRGVVYGLATRLRHRM